MFHTVVGGIILCQLSDLQKNKPALVSYESKMVRENKFTYSLFDCAKFRFPLYRMFKLFYLGISRARVRIRILNTCELLLK